MFAVRAGCGHARALQGLTTRKLSIRFASRVAATGAVLPALDARGRRGLAAASTPADSETTARPEFPPQRLNLSVDEALYLAKEANIYTTREVQMQIMRSPPFSPRERPFVIENFFETVDDSMVRRQDGPDDQDGEDYGAVDEDDEKDLNTADTVIHGTIQQIFRPDLPEKFVHNGQEWLSRAEGRGTRKRAVAHVVIQRGSGIFKVNGEADVYSWWPLYFNRIDVCQPFQLTGTACAYDVFAEVAGGGPSGQAGATRLAVARALLQANPTCHDDLQRGFCLLEDFRQRMSHMPGKRTRRAGWKWNKR